MNFVNNLHCTAEHTSTVVRFLHPGDVACVECHERLETLLGSCVAIVLTDPRRTIGAMCHIVHCKAALGIVDNPGAYADVALDIMYALLRKRGFRPELCEAFVYGGGNMFPEQFTQAHVGEENCRWVLNRLKRDGVRIAFHDLGGNIYRRLSWTVGPGMPLVQSVSVQAN